MIISYLDATQFSRENCTYELDRYKYIHSTYDLCIKTAILSMESSYHLFSFTVLSIPDRMSF